MIQFLPRNVCNTSGLALVRPSLIAAVILSCFGSVMAEDTAPLSVRIGKIGDALKQPSGSDWQWQIRPKGFVYDTYWASAQEPRLGVQIVDEAGSGSLMDSALGGRIGLFRYGPRDSTEGWQLDIAAAAALRQDADDNLDVISTDRHQSQHAGSSRDLQFFLPGAQNEND